MNKQTNNADQDKIDLKVSEAMFRNIVLWSPDAIIVTDAKGKIEYINPAAEGFFNRKMEDFIGEDFGLPLVDGKSTEIDIFRPGKEPGFGDMYVVETEWLNKKAHLITIRDITERKKMEESLRISEDRYRSTIELTGLLAWTTDSSGEIAEDIPIWRKFTGLSYDETKSSGWIKSLHPEDTEHVMQVWNKAIKDKSTYEVEYRLRRFDGAYRSFMARGIPVFKEGGGIREWVGINIDITERKLAEKKIRQSESKYKTLLEALPQKIFYKDINSVYVACNENYAKDLKIKSSEITGKTDDDFFPKDLAEKYRADDKKIIELGNIENIEEKYVVDSQEMWVHTIKAPLRDEKDNVIGIIGIFWDITISKQVEELTKARLIAETASHAKSEFLANMSHELRTPLNSINGFSEVLYDETFGPLNEKQKKYTNNILTSGKHLLQLINQILDMAKVEAGKMNLTLSNLSIKILINDISMLVRDIIDKKKIEILLEIAEDLPNIEADDLKVREIFYNLISNAVKFTPSGGKIGIRAKKTDSVIEIVIWDNGCGIAPENIEKIFEGFVRIDTPYSRVTEGTGLGLPLSKKLVELHGGKFFIESAGLNKGTSVRFTLPIKMERR
jgi:PAS domain S-box/PAS domain S-box/PAS domain S-box